MAGKYATIVPKLPKYVDPDQTRAKRVQTTIDSIRSTATERGETINTGHLAACYAELRKEKDALKEKLSSIELEIEAFSKMLEDAYEADGITSQRLLDGGSVSVEYQPYGSIVDPLAFRSWCIKNGYETEMRLMPATVQSIIKERLVNGEPEPDGTKSFVMAKLVYRK